MRFSRLLLAPLMALLAACATTSTSELVSVSRDPDMAGKSYGKVFVMALAKTEDRRRVVEDAVVARLQDKGVEAIASHSKIAKLDLGDEKALREAAVKAVSETGADAALVGTLLKEEKRTEHAAPQVTQSPVPTSPYFMGYGAYMGYGYQTIVTPGELVELHEYFLQTTLYDAGNEKPVWRAQSKTLNPENLDQAVADVADMLADRLAVDGVLKAGPAPARTGGY